jgi:hypothetical protein
VLTSAYSAEYGRSSGATVTMVDEDTNQKRKYQIVGDHEADATKDKPIGIQAEADWAKTIHVMEDAGVLKKGSRPGDYFTNDFFDPQYLASLLK